MTRLARLVHVLAFSLLATARLAAQEPDAAPPPPPDRVVLKNGDTLTGKVLSMEDGKLKLEHAVLGTIEIAFADMTDLVTGAPVTLVTKAGETLQRRVTGIADDQLRLAGAEPGQPEVDSLSRGELTSINPDTKVKWTGAINAGGAISTGNTEKRTANLNAEAERRTEADRITAKALWIYEEDKNDGEWNLVDRILRGSLKYDYFLTEKLYAVALAAAGADASANLELRFTMGGGLGYQWFEGGDFELFTEGTVNYFTERYDDPSADDDYIAARLAYGLKWKLTEDLQLLHDLQYFPSLEDKDDLYVIKDTRVRLSLTESMFTQAQWILEFDNTPNLGDERLDNKYLFTFGWTF